MVECQRIVAWTNCDWPFIKLDPAFGIISYTAPSRFSLIHSGSAIEKSLAGFDFLVNEIVMALDAG